jgi:hypothetical protein
MEEIRRNFRKGEDKVMGNAEGERKDQLQAN